MDDSPTIGAGGSRHFHSPSNSGNVIAQPASCRSGTVESLQGLSTRERQSYRLQRAISPIALIPVLGPSILKQENLFR
jgi:hypothetical protein